jgi:hypothetical protein
MSQESLNAESSLEAQLVAYLDGELDSQSCRRIEELLATDPEVRRKLQWLERTWEMLDELDATPVGEDFTRTTLEMVAVAAEKDVRQMQDEAPRRRRRMWLFCGAGLILSAVAGFSAVSLTAASANRQLLQDLPLLENLDEYRQIKDIQFLRMLRDNGLFLKEKDSAAVQPAPARTEDYTEEHVKSLPIAQKYELLRKQQRFKPEERDRLRQLHDEIQQDPELRGIMERYYEWYNSRLLSDFSRAELTDASSSEKRIQLIKKFIADQESKIAIRLPPGKDADALWNWMEQYSKKQENQLIEGLPEELQKNLKRLSPAVRSRWVLWMMWQRRGGPQQRGPGETAQPPATGAAKPGQSEAPRLPQLSDADISDLRSRLTPDIREFLEAKPRDEQVRIVLSWAHNLLREKRGPRVGEFVDDKTLAEFFEKELTEDPELTDQERERLMGLSGEEMQRELLRLYINKNRPPDLFRGRSGGFPPGPPPESEFQRPPRPAQDADKTGQPPKER